MNARCVVYVIGENNGPYKIGLGHDPERRLFQIQAGNPRPLRVYGVWDVKP
jgi:predicted GIY-YIG superfamily endonuclease